jgi:hypothetical protein
LAGPTDEAIVVINLFLDTTGVSPVFNSAQSTLLSEFQHSRFKTRSFEVAASLVPPATPKVEFQPQVYQTAPG